jgi:hypothetical protein
MKKVGWAAIFLVFIIGRIFLPFTVLAQKSVFLGSPAFNLDISLNFKGVCDPYDGAVFSQYSAISSFNNMHFTRSLSPDHPCWLKSSDLASSFMIHGEGRIVTFQICPDFDPDPQNARITSGPDPFRPTLTILDKDEIAEYTSTLDDIPVLPLGPLVYIRYSDNFRVVDQELKWETEIGKGVIESRSCVFCISSISLGEGKPVKMTVPYQEGKETGNWDIEIIPVK